MIAQSATFCECCIQRTKVVKIISKSQRRLRNLVLNNIMVDVAKKNESARIGAGNGYNGTTDTILREKETLHLAETCEVCLSLIYDKQHFQIMPSNIINSKVSCPSRR